MTDDLDSALQLIASRLGVNIADFTDRVAAPQTTSTFSEYIAKLRTASPRTTTRNYSSYWRIFEDAWGDRTLDEPTATDLVQRHRSRAVVRANSRGGRGAAANMVSALRCIYRHAELDGLISPADNPAQKIAKPRRLDSPRHALTRDQVIAIGEVASSTGNDTELDALIVRIHIEAACRRAGVLGLQVGDLDPDSCLLRLREKGETIRWQPISPLRVLHRHRPAPRHGPGRR